MNQKHVPANVFLKCDKGVTPCRLQIARTGPSLYDEKWAVESDAIPLVNISSFGVCAVTRAPCVPATVRWQKTLLGSTKVMAFGLPQNPLLDDSFLPCTVGGKIDIFFTRAAVAQAMADEAQEEKQLEQAKQVSEGSKRTSMFLLVAAIAVAAVVVVATGGLAGPVVAAALMAGAVGAGTGAIVGGVAGGMDGYAHGGAMGAVKGALMGAGIGALAGGLGGMAAVAGGPVALALLETSAITFGVATAADAFTFYKRPTMTNGLVLASDLVGIFGARAVGKQVGRAIESQARGGKALETPTGAPKEQCTKAGDPVDVASGAMFFDAIDLSLPGPVPFIWERTWYSNSDRQGPLGHGWHHRYDLALWLDTESATMFMRLDDGRLAAFEVPDANNDYCTYYRARQLELRPLPEGQDGYAVSSMREGFTYRFLPSAQQAGHYILAAVEDAYGHALRFTYSTQDHLLGIVDSAGRPIGVRTDAAGRILALDLPHADGSPGTFPAVQYAYDELGNLTRVTNAEGHAMRFAHQGHLMVQKTFATGMSFYFEYDEQRRCTHTWGDEGYYDCRFTYAPGHTRVLAAEPAAVDEYYHERGLVTTHINPLGAAHHRRYNAHNELEAEQDALGHTTSYDYDARGNCTGISYPDGATEQTQYNERGQPLAQTNPVGSSWHWQYNAQGQLIGRLDPLGASTRYGYDSDGRLVEVRDALGHATRLRYDAQHNLAHIVAPDDTIRSRTSDALGRLVGLTDALGQVQRRRYDRLGQVIGIQEADGRQTALAYDGEGNMVHAHDDEQEVSFAYTAVKYLAVRRQAGQEIRFSYDRQVRLTGLTNEHGRHHRFRLDTAGQVMEEEGFDGLLRRYERDAAGRVTTVQRPAERTTAYTYDAAGRVTGVMYHDGTAEAYAYDAAGALTEARNAHGTVRLERDTLGRVAREHQNDHFIDHTYDARGQRATLQSSLGAAFAWQHDALGNAAVVRAGDDWHAHLLHDVRGLELQRTFRGGLRVGWQRDALGRPTQQHVLGGPGPGRQRRYQWQGSDRLTEIDDSLGGRTHYDYDPTGTLTGARHADGGQDVRLPDAVGNLFRSPARDDRTYAPGGQLREANGTRYQYDAEGNLVRKTTRAGAAWHYAWNGAGQLAAVTRPDGYSVRFTYDALGRRLSKHYRGRATRWVWDGDKPLHEWHELEVGPGAGSVQDLATWLFEEDSFAPAAKLTAQGAQSVVCDHLGTPLSMYDGQGKATWEMTLDAYGGVRQGRGKPQDCPFRYQGQYEDVETGLYYNRFRYYDPEAGQYISQDPIGLVGGIKFYSYVKSTATWVDALGLVGCDRNVNAIVERHGGKLSESQSEHGPHRYDMPSRRAAKAAASEISGNLGSDPVTIRRSEYTDPNNTYRNNNSNRVIGKHAQNGEAGYHDHEIGHSRFGAPRHFNAWSKSTGTAPTENVHLYY